MGKFGWSYPPGAANDPNAPWNQVEGPCEVCGKCVDDCICPECPVCGEQGNGYCYRDHGIEKSDEQCDSLAKETAKLEARLAADEASYDAYYKEEFGDDGYWKESGNG